MSKLSYLCPSGSRIDFQHVLLYWVGINWPYIALLFYEANETLILEECTFVGKAIYSWMFSDLHPLAWIHSLQSGIKPLLDSVNVYCSSNVSSAKMFQAQDASRGGAKEFRVCWFR